MSIDRPNIVGKSSIYNRAATAFRRPYRQQAHVLRPNLTIASLARSYTSL